MAFQSPVRLGRVAAKAISKTPAFMSPMDVAVDTTNAMSHFSNLVAAESDFGGYVGPAGSLLLIAFLILTLAPPLAEKNKN
eukprot:gene34931-42302_t